VEAHPAMIISIPKISKEEIAGRGRGGEEETFFIPSSTERGFRLIERGKCFIFVRFIDPNSLFQSTRKAQCLPPSPPYVSRRRVFAVQTNQEKKIEMEDRRTDLKGMSPDELARFITSLGKEKYRTKQLLSSMYAIGVSDFEAMTDLSKSFR